MVVSGGEGATKLVPTSKRGRGFLPSALEAVVRPFGASFFCCSSGLRFHCSCCAFLDSSGAHETGGGETKATREEKERLSEQTSWRFRFRHDPWTLSGSFEAGLPLRLRLRSSSFGRREVVRERREQVLGRWRARSACGVASPSLSARE